MHPEGYLVSCKIFPGEGSDVEGMRECVEELRERFGVKRVIWVSDGGTISERNLKIVKGLGYEYIVGGRMRKIKGGKELVKGEEGYEKVRENL